MFIPRGLLVQSRDHVVALELARSVVLEGRSEMATSSGTNETAVGQPHLAKQDLGTLVSAHACAREQCVL